MAGMATRTKQPKNPPPGDKLADLREAWGADDEPTTQPEATEPEGDDEGEVRPLISRSLQDEAARRAVVAWHNDPVAQGFIHRGGTCGCQYLARLAFAVSAPAELDATEGDEGNATA